MKKIAVLCLLTLLLVSCGKNAQVGDEAYDFQVEDFNSETVNLSDYKGKTVFILAWTST